MAKKSNPILLYFLCTLVYLLSFAGILFLSALIQAHVGFMSVLMLWPYGFGFVPACMAACGPVYFSLGLLEGHAQNNQTAGGLVTVVLYLSLAVLGYGLWKRNIGCVISQTLAVILCITMKQDLKHSAVQQ